MHKYVLKFFLFLKNTIEFFQILTLFGLILLLFYWNQNLLNAHWGWLSFASPILGFMVELSSKITDGAVYLFDAVFELKYGMTALFFVGIYWFCKLLLLGLVQLEEFYYHCRFLKKQAEEREMNAEMAAEMSAEAKKMKSYKIYVETVLKQNIYTEVNMKEQNNIMNKFLIEQTSVVPTAYENGFLYEFSPVDDIDRTLKNFFKLIKSDAPIDFIICVQAYGHDYRQEEAQLKKLISLRHLNKISIASDTCWRYQFNRVKLHTISQLGLFQKDGSTMEVLEFKEIENL